MKKQLLISGLLAGSALLGFSVIAAAQEGPHGPGGPMGPRLEELDANKDGKITKAEIDAMEVKTFTEADTNKDGFVTSEEMTAHHEARMEEMRRARMKEHQDRMLAKLDTDKDGRISEAEFTARPNPMFDRIDTNKDGIVDAAEIEVAKEKAKKMQGKMGKFREWRGVEPD